MIRLLRGNRFTVECFGRTFHFMRQSAAQQLSHCEQAGVFMRSFAPRDADKNGELYALAYHCVLLTHVLRGVDRLLSPQAALRRYSTGQIARLSECYYAHDEQPATLIDTDYEECGFNESYDTRSVGVGKETEKCEI